MKLFKPMKVIYKENKIPLLLRWNVFECRFFSIKIHKLLSSDNSCPHDHPWPFITFLLSSGYVEYFNFKNANKGQSRVRSRWSILYRPANYLHRLEIHQPVWTFVITFKKERMWGFLTATGWIPFFKYSRQNHCE